ncbi:MAG: dihydroorotase [Pseudomonadota bacterium]
MTDRLTLPRPDDWHLHLRDSEVLEAVLTHSSAQFARAIVMPNLVPPVTHTADAVRYRDAIIDALPAQHRFTPLMTLYLTESTDGADLIAGFEAGVVTAVKLYPAGATTNSQSGVRDIDAVMPVLEAMAGAGMPLLVHGEVTDPTVDIFDREAVFIERVLEPLVTKLPSLRVVLEHITTSDGVEFVRSRERNVAATITPHHLVWNRTHLFEGGIRPHRYCLPVVKRERHREALVDAAQSGDGRFFLGTDSAPHVDPTKETACGCAGVFNVVTTLPCLAHVFEDAGRLDRLRGFVAEFGPAFYGLPVNSEQVTLVRRAEPYPFPSHIDSLSGPITVFDPGFPLHWTLEGYAP